MRGLLVALQFLTRVPVPWPRDHRSDDLARATLWFAPVGLGIGGLLGGVGWGLHQLGLPQTASAVLVAAILGPLVTGALHEDGLGDTADGLGGGRDRASTLRILRDSRVGAYGVVAIVAALLLRVALLDALSPELWPLALALAHALGRAATVPLMRALLYAREQDQGVASRMVEGLGWGRVLVGLALAASMGALAGLRGGVAVAVAALLTLLAGLGYRRRLGGITGDLLGAACLLVELGVLTVMAWAR